MDDFKIDDLRSVRIDPALSAALVEASAKVEAVAKRGKNEQLRGKAYATADDINAAARQAMTDAGAAIVRIGHDLEAGRLADFDLGNQAYAGDVVERWLLVHRDGGGLVFTTRTAVVVSKGRPHDKATSASQTYNSGVVARGVLAMEREDKHAVDSRQDRDDGQPTQRRPRPAPGRSSAQLEPRCSAGVANLLVANVKALAGALDWTGPEVWEDLLRRAGVDLSVYLREIGAIPDQPKKLSKKDASLVKKEASIWLAELAAERAKAPEDPSAENAP